MKKIIYLLLTLVLLASTAEAEKWELIDNKTTVPRPNNKTNIFVLHNTEVLNNSIYSVNRDGLYSIIKSDDYGKNWDSCVYAPLNNIGASTNFYKLLNHNNNLFAPADNGRLYHSFNNGETWDFTFFGEKDNHPIQHIKFVNENVGFLGLIYDNILTKTTNGGKTWNPLPISKNVFPPNFSFLNFVPLDENNIVIITLVQNNIRFFRTKNGGESWEEFESELFEETQFVNQEYDNIIYQAPYTYVESGFKASKEGHTRIMRTTDFEKWDPVFISDTISGGKRIKSFQIYNNIMFGYGDRIFIYSIDDGNTWIDLYDEGDEFYKNGNSEGFAYIDNYAYSQGNVKYTDDEGNIQNTKKMFRLKLDIQSSVESGVSNLNVYPNPAKDELNIIYDKGINSILILDLNGKAILSNNNLAPQMEQSINIDYLQTGTYFIKINDNIYKRFVKE
ncbi:MAG: hypothetical protein CVV25_09050 [Ignavibacteriae bacterium HGW-Ignavibacteriae-4]|jgi:hypothetical protein|nr:MAG: hypothetical protein CVV25_09050 [Ignavibacteriae bacterium HGW-Ignavibacteriae-4]